ncbi:hypothetical protein CHARACLAT_015278 [Characodon lateralis]|uniref:Uncharacterized protein n=1 Tax=Characodon lateralis TaxID=208331 RepID=A0ABU7EAA6_9TELE|nr:hypothetical protein [Characodon lateralis]
MADSETDGRGSTRPGNPITFISLASRFPCSCALQQLINRQGPGEPGISASDELISANTHKHTCAQTNSQRFAKASTSLLLLLPTSVRFHSKQTDRQAHQTIVKCVCLYISPAGGGKEEVS